MENTSMIRLFKIVSEGGVSAGVRRIEALTGDMALNFLLKHTQENQHVRQAVGLQENWTSYIDNPKPLMSWVEAQKQEIKNLNKKFTQIQSSQTDFDKILKHAENFNKEGEDGRFVFADLDIEDRQMLSQINDRLRDKIGSGVVVLVGKGQDSHPIIVSVTKNLSKVCHAGHILKEVASAMGGKGGGRPDFAQGAAKNRQHIAKAKTSAQTLLGL